jgi:hypothetical protein
MINSKKILKDQLSGNYKNIDVAILDSFNPFFDKIDKAFEKGKKIVPVNLLTLLKRLTSTQRTLLSEGNYFSKRELVDIIDKNLVKALIDNTLIIKANSKYRKVGNTLNKILYDIEIS